MSTVLAPERSYGSAAPAVRPSPRPDPRPAPRTRPRVDPRVDPRVEPTTRREHLRVVRPEERTARRLTPLAGVALTAVVFAVLFAVAGAHTLIAQGQIRLDGLDKKVSVEQSRYQQLRKDVAQAESPDRVVAAAEAEGMVSPQDLVYLQPSSSGSSADDRSNDSSPTGDAEVATGSYSTVKPMLETPTP